MKKKLLQATLGITLGIAAMAASAPCPALFAEEATEVAADVDSSAENETDIQDIEAADNVEEAAEEETEAVTEENDFVEGSAVLADYSFEKGDLTEDGYSSECLKLTYVPGENVTMGTSQNEKLSEYHLRNGEDKQVANNELVALLDNGSYIQMMAEVNPNHEPAEDILGNFSELLGLKLVSKAKEQEIGGMKMQTCTGVLDKDKYFIAVAAGEESDFAVALKCKYTDPDSRDLLVSGFSALDENKAAEEETTEEVSTEDADTEDAVEEDVDIVMPEEFVENGDVSEES